MDCVRVALAYLQCMWVISLLVAIVMTLASVDKMALERFNVSELSPSVQEKYYCDYYGKQWSVALKTETGSGRAVPLPEFYLGHLDIVKDFKVRDDDVWILTYPKTGTTFASEMIWLLVADLDYEEAARVKLVSRLTHLEFPVSRKSNISQYLVDLEHKPSPRVIRAHLSLDLLPSGLMGSKAKIIYVTRDPRDTAISLFHHMTGFSQCRASLDQFLNGFLDGDLMYGSMFDHVSEFRKESEVRPGMLMIRFEEMKDEMGRVLEKLCRFLGKSYSAQQLATLEDHLQFSKMKENPAVNLSELNNRPENASNATGGGQFMRKGKIGSYVEEMPMEFIKRFDEKIDVWDCKDIVNSRNNTQANRE